MDALVKHGSRHVTNDTHQSILESWHIHKDASPDLAFQVWEEPEIGWSQIRGVGGMFHSLHGGFAHCSKSFDSLVSRCIVVEQAVAVS